MGPKYALPLHVGRHASTEVCIEVCMGPKYVWTEVYTYMYFGTEVWDRSMPCLYMWDALPLPKYVPKYVWDRSMYGPKYI